jgi:RND family efflux transporter MFP subunit
MIQTQKIRILIVLSVLLSLVLLSCTPEKSGEYTVKKGDFTQTVTETGELMAVNTRAFVMQRFGRYWYEMRIIGLLEHGTRVQAGDSIIQFDPSEVQKFIIDRETQYETQKANLEKILVEIDNRNNELQSTLKSEEASFELKKIEVEQYRFESERAKKRKAIEFEQAKIRLEKVKKSIEFYQVISEKQLQIQKIRVQQIRDQINEAYQVLDQLTIRTPIPGIFQIARKRRSRQQIAIGDEVYVGNSLGNVPDLTWMKVNTVINEADFMKVKTGQKVNVRLDALPDVTFDGEVSSISKLCRPLDNDSRQKVFDVEVNMLVSDQRLKPGMTVSCEFICKQLSNVLYVPGNYIEIENDKRYVYRKTAGGSKKTEVITGQANNRFIVIESGLTKGQKIISPDKVDQTKKL